MLKILIIDDDMLTRKGIQMMMPWAKYNMKIVGEASNGKAALDFLREHEVDLALVDIDMPVMNGITFIQEASKLYPELNYVVLTIHTEFEYIQNVLRLGAIDYIAKTQFDQENFDQILNRIQAALIRKIGEHTSVRSSKWRESQILYPAIYALITLETETEEPIEQFLELNDLTDGASVYDLMPGAVVFTDERTEFFFPEYFRNTALLKISDVSDMTYSQLAKMLRKYRKEQFFYDYQPLKTINHKRAYELAEDAYISDDATLEKLKNDWISLNWIHENELFQKFRIDLKNSKLKFSSLYHLLLSLENVWNTSYSELTGESISLPESFHHWSEVEEWLMEVYEKTNLFSSSSRYSSEVTRSVLIVKKRVDTEYTSSFDTTEVARTAGMSYGYFSRCFHDIVGMPFNEYCTLVRITKAKELLLNTGNSIQQIAFDVGYNDEKYFSRLFKKHTGQSPSEFRRQ